MPIPAPLTGVVPPVCTPLTPDREVDVPSLVNLVDHLVGAGVDGLFVLGSSSEAAYLTDAQRRLVVETVKAHLGGRLPLLAGVIDMTTPRVLDHVAAVTAAGADAVVATAPFYARTHPAEIARHYRLIAARSSVPVFAYDLPVSVHTKLGAELVLELAADGVLAGLKDSSGDLGGFRAVVTGAKAHPGVTGFSVLTGSELVVDSALALGADGAVPGLANVVGGPGTGGLPGRRGGGVGGRPAAALSVLWGFGAWGGGVNPAPRPTPRPPPPPPPPALPGGGLGAGPGRAGAVVRVVRDGRGR
ncbi:dihydrodipicolinate synthase family protein [Streptomyces sp. NPDC059466]|uniref:dihydrodipicolinate synthase family protein n=1 Tax=Streptomyces sp. NPDC059466 TaxID=3346843 RepID=UPI0036BB6206